MHLNLNDNQRAVFESFAPKLRAVSKTTYVNAFGKVKFTDATHRQVQQLDQYFEILHKNPAIIAGLTKQDRAVLEMYLSSNKAIPFARELLEDIHNVNDPMRALRDPATATDHYHKEQREAEERQEAIAERWRGEDYQRARDAEDREYERFLENRELQHAREDTQFQRYRDDALAAGINPRAAFGFNWSTGGGLDITAARSTSGGRSVSVAPAKQMGFKEDSTGGLDWRALSLGLIGLGRMLSIAK